VNPSPVEAIGPAPFRFQPAGGDPLRAPAFSVFFKALATVLLSGAAGWFWHLWLAGRVGAGTESIFSWFVAALLLMLCTWWSIVRSVTCLDGAQLRQSWLWNKKMDLRELAYAKLIRVRGLDWLIAPRLYARTLEGKFAVFYTADARMIAEFERLVGELADFRKLR
jgi:hypothetical protein